MGGGNVVLEPADSKLAQSLPPEFSTGSHVRARYAEFARFSQTIRSAIDRFAGYPRRTRRLRELYSVAVDVGPGRIPRSVAVFFGWRGFEVIRNDGPPPSDGSFRTKFETLSEKGARLDFSRLDSGWVMCILTPARTPNMRRIEDGVVLLFRADPAQLQSSIRLERYWGALVSYMHCTCLEGEPTYADRIRIWWLLSTRHLIVDGVSKRPRCLTTLSSLIYFAATVGLSGFLLALIQLWLHPK